MRDIFRIHGPKSVGKAALNVEHGSPSKIRGILGSLQKGDSNLQNIGETTMADPCSRLRQDWIQWENPSSHHMCKPMKPKIPAGCSMDPELPAFPRGSCGHFSPNHIGRFIIV